VRGLSTAAHLTAAVAKVVTLLAPRPTGFRSPDRAANKKNPFMLPLLPMRPDKMVTLSRLGFPFFCAAIAPTVSVSSFWHIRITLDSQAVGIKLSRWFEPPCFSIANVSSRSCESIRGSALSSAMLFEVNTRIRTN